MDVPEIWKDVEGQEGFYAVSNLGRVRSLRSGKLLKPWTNGGRVEYLQVSMQVGGKRDTRTVHTMVLKAFVGPRPPEHEGLHGPRGSFCNELSNLRWGTRRENVEDQFAAGTFARGSKSGVALLTEKDIPLIRADTRRLKEIAADYGVHLATISCVKLRKSWAHV